MLFKLSFKNIKKSMKDYAIYFFTLIVGVAIFYVFNAIEKQGVMLKITADQRKTIQVIVKILSSVSVFVSLILGFLIIYASRFLIKRRNKEFGIYLLLGMGKRKISMILFIETLLIGMISLVVGLIIGVFFSQFMSIFIANTFEADMTKFKFIFSKNACIKTIMYFGIMYLIVIVFNIFIIGKCKLIHLIQAERKNEKVKIKNPVLCTIIFVVAVGMLGYAYYIVTAGVKYIMKNPQDRLIMAIVLGAVSTFLIFWSVSGLLLRIVMSLKKTYYKGLNSFMIRQISSKINTTVFSMTIICLMLFVTICVMSVATSVKKSEEDGVKKNCKADIEFFKFFSSRTTYEQREEQMVYLGEENNIINLYQNAGYDLESYLKKYVEYYTYSLYMISDGEVNSACSVVSLSDYNKIAEMYKNKTYELEENEYIIIGGSEVQKKELNDRLAKGTAILVNGYELVPKYTTCRNEFIELTDGNFHPAVYIVPDNTLAGCEPMADNLIGNYKANTKEERYKIEEEIMNMQTTDSCSIESKISLYNDCVGVGIMFTFIGSYIGIIFLISGAAILALKELSESADNISRYAVLRKIGADEKMINKALFGQIGIFFAFPLLLACIHSVFGIKFGTYLTSIFGSDGLLPAIIVTAVVIGLIYGGYFILTYLCSKSIIKSRN